MISIKYYNSYDATFLTNEFTDSFIDLKGKKHKKTITSVSVYIAVIGVDMRTGQPRYMVNVNDDETENPEYSLLFSATINAELGVLVIPNVKAIAAMEKETGLNIAGKIIEYVINPDSAIGISVPEAEFVRIIKENFDKFNIPDNYHGQSASYGCHKVTKDVPRVSWKIGYDINGNVVCSSYGDDDDIYTFVTTANTEAKAQHYTKLLKNITPEELHLIRRDRTRNVSLLTAIEKYSREKNIKAGGK